ncbi:hypothetical protein LCGC14_2746210, partial [marine sediment metagenome]
FKFISHNNLRYIDELIVRFNYISYKNNYGGINMNKQGHPPLYASS